jgi:hypothetical protein
MAGATTAACGLVQQQGGAPDASGAGDLSRYIL